MVARSPIALAVFLVVAPAGCDKKSESASPEVAAKPAESAAPSAPSPAPAGEAELAARTPKAKRMPLAEPMTRCNAAGKWKLKAEWRKGEGRCKGAPTDRDTFSFEIADQDGEYAADLNWSSYAPNAVEVTVDGAECLVDLQLDSLRVSGAGLIFNLSEKDGKVTGEGMYEAPIDLDSGRTCLREFDVTGEVVHADK